MHHGPVSGEQLLVFFFCFFAKWCSWPPLSVHCMATRGDYAVPRLPVRFSSFLALKIVLTVGWQERGCLDQAGPTAALLANAIMVDQLAAGRADWWRYAAASVWVGLGWVIVERLLSRHGWPTVGLLIPFFHSIFFLRSLLPVASNFSSVCWLIEGRDIFAKRFVLVNCTLQPKPVGRWLVAPSGQLF